jgi:hypothetical protein
MAKAREKFEKIFEALSRWLYANSLKVLPIILLLIGFFAVQIPSITIDTSSEALLRKDDPSLIEYNRFRDQFGRAELIIIAVQSPEIFESAFFKRLQSFQDDLENEIPYLRKITSLINVRNTKGNEDQLIVESLMAGWPRKSINMTALKEQVGENPFYLNYLISEDGHVTAVVVETEASVVEPAGVENVLDDFDEGRLEIGKPSVEPHYFSEKENREVVEAIKRVVKRHHGKDFMLTASGGPIIVDAFNRATLKDVRSCVLLSLISVAFFLGILFRRLSGVLLPILIIVSALLSTLGLMAMMKVPIKITTTVIPAFLLSVGVCDSVHVLAIFYLGLRQGKTKEKAIVYALGHSGIPIFMTSLTTIAGLLSFTLADLTAIAEIGIFAAAGVMIAFIYTIVLLPVLLSLTPLKPTFIRKTNFITMDRLLGAIADFSTRHPFKIIIASLVFFFVFFPAIFQLKFSHNIVQYFPDAMPYRKDLQFIDQKLKGSITLEVVMDTGHENGIYNPWILNRIEDFSRHIERLKHADLSVGKVFSITDILKEIHQALNANNPAYYRIPQERKIVAQEFFLFENSGADDLERIIDSQFSKTRITIKAPWVDAVVCRDFIQNINQKSQEIFQDKATIHATGLMALLARAISAAIYSMAKSYLIAFLVITMLMIVLIGNLKIGLVSMIPNLLPILITMGIMGSFYIPLDINSLMIGSIAIGIVVDDTVHFMYNFQKYYDKTPNPFYAVRETILGTGRALLITSLVLCTGFFVLMLASLKHLVRFGFFTGITILIALLADFLLVPALLVVLKQHPKTVGG